MLCLFPLLILILILESCSSLQQKYSVPLLLPFLECECVSKDLKDNRYKDTLQKSAIVRTDGACVTPATGPVVLNREVALGCCDLEYA